MLRVSNTLMSSAFKNNILGLESKLFKTNNQVSSGKEIEFASDNPYIAVKSIKLHNSLKMIDQYQKNITEAKGYMEYAETTMRSINDVISRARELAVYAANGTLTDQDRKKIAAEVNQLLERVVNLSNEKYNGKALFAGFETIKEPFVFDVDQDKIKSVYYAGDDGEKFVNFGTQEMKYTIPGNKLFYSEKETIIPQGNFLNFISDQDYTIKINGKEINIYQGDTIEDIISRINKADAGITANINVDTQEFYLTTTEAHKPFLEDVNGNLLEKLNIIDPSKKPPMNIKYNARHFGGSLFDQLISFRDALERNDSEAIGSRVVQFLDMSSNHILKYVAELGAKQQNLNLAEKYFENQQLNLQDALSNTEEVDITEKITSLKSIELMHQAALQVGSRLNNLTLLNFLR